MGIPFKYRHHYLLEYLVGIVCNFIGLITLAYYRPTWDYSVVFWAGSKQIQDRINNGK